MLNNSLFAQNIVRPSVSVSDVGLTRSLRGAVEVSGPLTQLGSQGCFGGTPTGCSSLVGNLISESEDNEVVHNSDLIPEISENLSAVPLDSNPLIPKESNESYEVEEEDDKYSHLSQEVNPIDWDLTSVDSLLEDSKVNHLWVRTEVVVEEDSNLSQEVNPIDWDLISESDDNEVRASPMPRVFDDYCHLSDEVNPIDWDVFSESEEISDLFPQTSENQRTR